jgi:hypothetical protein
MNARIPLPFPSLLHTIIVAITKILRKTDAFLSKCGHHMAATSEGVMEPLDPILRLTRVGCFGQALQAFSEMASTIPNRPAAGVLRAQVLAQVGQSESALALATTLLKSKNLTIVQRSECEAVVGKILFDEGDADRGLGHQQRAVLTAEQATDLRSTFGQTVRIHYVSE